MLVLLQELLSNGGLVACRIQDAGQNERIEPGADQDAHARLGQVSRRLHSSAGAGSRVHETLPTQFLQRVRQRRKLGHLLTR